MARTTLDLDEKIIAEGMAATGARSKKALIEEAVRELTRARARDELVKSIKAGTLDAGMTLEELLAWRRSSLKRIQTREGEND